MSNQPNPAPIIIRLLNVRISFPHLWQPHAMEGSTREPSFSATFILDCIKHRTLIDQIEKAIDRTALTFFGKAVRLKHRCLRDGNEKPELDGYGDGKMFLMANCKTRPPVVHRVKVTPILEEDRIILPGYRVNANVNLFAWNHKTGGMGVSAGLRAVQFVEVDEVFGAPPVDPETEFENLDDGDDSGGKWDGL